MTFIDSSVKTQVPPVYYLMMVVSLVIGVSFAVNAVDATHSVLYDAGVLLPRAIWGMFLAASVLIGIVGLALNQHLMTRLGCTAAFMAWVFASISLAQEGEWYVLATVSAFHLLFQGWVVLADSIGILRRT